MSSDRRMPVAAAAAAVPAAGPEFKFEGSAVAAASGGRMFADTSPIFVARKLGKLLLEKTYFFDRGIYIGGGSTGHTWFDVATDGSHIIFSEHDVLGLEAAGREIFIRVQLERSKADAISGITFGFIGNKALQDEVAAKIAPYFEMSYNPSSSKGTLTMGKLPEVYAFLNKALEQLVGKEITPAPALTRN